MPRTCVSPSEVVNDSLGGALSECQEYQKNIQFYDHRSGEGQLRLYVARKTYAGKKYTAFSYPREPFRGLEQQDVSTEKHADNWYVSMDQSHLLVPTPICRRYFDATGLTMVKLEIAFFRGVVRGAIAEFASVSNQ